MKLPKCRAAGVTAGVKAPDGALVALTACYPARPGPKGRPGNSSGPGQARVRVQSIMPPAHGPRPGRPWSRSWTATPCIIMTPAPRIRRSRRHAAGGPRAHAPHRGRWTPTPVSVLTQCRACRPAAAAQAAARIWNLGTPEFRYDFTIFFIYMNSYMNS